LPTKYSTGAAEWVKAAHWHGGRRAGAPGRFFAFRVIAVADVLEAMTARRPYRPALPLGAAL